MDNTAFLIYNLFMNIYNGDKQDTTNFTSSEYLKINSASISNYGKENHKVIREKGRLDYHLIFVISGVLEAVTSQGKRTLKSGDAVLYYPNEKQEYRFFKNLNTTTAWVHFTGVGVDKILNALNLKSGVYKVSQPENVEALLKNASKYSLYKIAKYDVIANNYLVKALTLLNSELFFGSDSFLIDKALQLVFENLNHNYSVKEISAFLNVSESYFMHLFKQKVGVSFIKYSTKIKISRAKELLSYSNLTINEIAYSLGYDDALYFSKIFKKLVGVSPKQFKNRS